MGQSFWTQDRGRSSQTPAYHSIVCIGAVVAERVDGVWQVRAVGAPHVGERREEELIQTFVAKIAELEPKLVTYNGSSFDLPVLRYRAMAHRPSAPGLSARPYFNRYTDDAEDDRLVPVDSAFEAQFINLPAALYLYLEYGASRRVGAPKGGCPMSYVFQSTLIDTMQQCAALAAEE